MPGSWLDEALHHHLLGLEPWSLSPPSLVLFVLYSHPTQVTLLLVLALPLLLGLLC